MWNAYAEAGKSSDYESPELAKYASGQARSTLVQGLYDYKKRGVVIRGTPILKPRITSLHLEERPPRAELQDCAEGSTWRNYDSAGRPVGHPDVQRQRQQRCQE